MSDWPAADWQTEDGRVRLYRGRCEDVMPTLPAGAFDVVITSPPYNLGNTSGGGFPSLGHYDPEGGMVGRGRHGKWRRASQAGGLGHGYDSHDDCMPHGEYVVWQQRCLAEMWRLVNDGGAIYYNHNPRIFGGRLVTPFDYNPGLPVRQVVIWARAGGINFSPTFYVPTHEWLVIFAKDGFRLKSKGASGVGDVWYIPQEANADHPAPFPLLLPTRVLETTAARSVLDPFAGSGTTLVAAARRGLSAVGIEHSPCYFATAVRRIERAMREPDLFREPAPSPVAESPDLFAP